MHIIIGAGIAGFYIAHQLFMQKKPFIILESSSKLRNKIVSVREEDKILELGASIFHSNQPKLLQFITDLGLDKKIKKSTGGTKRYVYNGYHTKEIERAYLAVYRKAANYSLHKGMSLHTVEENALECLDKSEFDLLKTCWNCWYENANMNAYTFYQQDTSNKYYYYLEGGLSQIMKECMTLFGDRVLFQHTVSHVLTYDGKYAIRCKGGQEFLCDKLYVCVSLNELPEIHFMGYRETVLEYCMLAQTQSSLRFFIVLKKDIQIDSQIVGMVWFKWMIRMSPSIYMIYVDHELADSINKMTDLELVSRWMDVINQMYGYQLKAKDLRKVIRAYWNAAYEVLLPKYFSDRGNILRKSLPFVCTALPTVYDQAYIEGHLLTIQ